jgi:prolipoprotein diacylglyceryl transferase
MMTTVPLGIPSPPAEWRSFNIGEWLRSLGLEWFSLNLVINAYALAILLGIIFSILIVNHRLTARGAEKWVVIDVALYAVPFGILGGRLFHVVTHPSDYFYQGANLWRVFYVWEGGLAIFGALLGGALGVWIGARIVGLRFWSFADALAPGLLVAQGVGRLGNYFNQELFGAPTNLPWGLQIDSTNRAIPVGLPEDTLFHPTFLYEMLWNFFGALVLLALLKRFGLQWGRLFGLYLVWYGIGRFLLETIRLDVAEVFFGLRSNQWAALTAIVVGLAIFLIQKSRHPGVEPSVYRPGREWEDPSALQSEDRYWLDENDQPLQPVTEKSSATSDEQVSRAP